MSYAEFIDLDRYPFQVEGPERDACIAQVREDLAQDGCAVLRGFLTKTGVEALVAEADATEDKAH